MQLAGTKDNFDGAMSFYCKNANIKSNHYSEILESLVKKGFAAHENYKYIKVLYPTEEEMCEIPQMVNMGENNSQNGKTADQNRNNNSEISKSDSQSCVNNKYIDNKNKEDRFADTETEYKNKVLEKINLIADRFNNESQLNIQLADMQNKGFTYEFMFYALDNKKIEDFSRGLGLLFYLPYQEEIKAKIEDSKRQKEMQKQRMIKNLEIIEQMKNKPKEVNYVRIEKIPQPRPLIEPIPMRDFLLKKKQKRNLIMNLYCKI